MVGPQVGIESQFYWWATLGSPALQKAPRKEAVDAHDSIHVPSLLWQLQPYHEEIFSLKLLI